LVVGAGQVASVVVARAVELGAAVTVCNRTPQRARRFAAAGAAVVDLAGLAERLAASGIAILATTAPRPLIDADLLRSARAAGAGPLTLVGRSMPRNVNPGARALPWIRLIDLADLRSDGTADAGDLVRDLAAPRRSSKPSCSAICAGSPAGRQLRRCTACAAAPKTSRGRSWREALAGCRLRSAHPWNGCC
jgi:ornithine cyclodeaminase/alanine dehydrogenase-like protein (mu-crystallin family)